MPMLDWADQDILWTEMLKKEDKYQHSPHIMENQSKLQPGMRAVLMEWLMEVRIFFLILLFSAFSPTQNFILVFQTLVRCLKQKFIRALFHL